MKVSAAIIGKDSEFHVFIAYQPNTGVNYRKIVFDHTASMQDMLDAIEVDCRGYFEKKLLQQI